VWSNHEQISAGPGFEFRADFFQVPWGKLIAEDWAVGANFNFMSTDTRFDLSDVELTRIRSNDYGFRLGVLHRPLESLRVGLTVDYGYVPVWTDLFDPFGPGTGTVRSKDAVQRVLVRPGIVWRYAPRGNLYADYQAGVFWNDTDTLWVHRIPIGIDTVVPRGGSFADSHARRASMMHPDGGAEARACEYRLTRRHVPELLCAATAFLCADLGMRQTFAF
jgi:hypothetical protein